MFTAILPDDPVLLIEVRSIPDCISPGGSKIRQVIGMNESGELLLPQRGSIGRTPEEYIEVWGGYRTPVRIPYPHPHSGAVQAQFELTLTLPERSLYCSEIRILAAQYLNLLQKRCCALFNNLSYVVRFGIPLR